MRAISITGAAINAAAILLGGGLGLLLKGRITDRFIQSILRAIGLCICIIGISGALGGDIMLMIISLAAGALLGELLNIDSGLNRFGLWIQKKLSSGDENSSFAEGFVTATLLFCVGAMAIVGSIDSGLRGDHSVILTKSILDGVSALLLASSLGIGVLFSAVAVLLYQGSIEFFAGYLQEVFTASLITQISAVGGVMVLAIGLNMVLNAKIKTANLLPGFLFAIGYYYFFLS
ncbi:MAG: DUF554 domain-containing protein [Oscillospiraceae bacterium]|nr:DUF554 domain-containing protein [Oscillospiraceae bacterium]